MYIIQTQTKLTRKDFIQSGYFEVSEPKNYDNLYGATVKIVEELVKLYHFKSNFAKAS